MSFDPRSLERLKELGRQLPKALPNPETETKPSTKANRPKHKVETEQNPEALFHELMNVSQDGTVPEHLMSRLRSAEQRLEDERRLRQVSYTESVDAGIRNGFAIATGLNPQGKARTHGRNDPTCLPAAKKTASMWPSASCCWKTTTRLRRSDLLQVTSIHRFMNISRCRIIAIGKVRKRWVEGIELYLKRLRD